MDQRFSHIMDCFMDPGGHVPPLLELPASRHPPRKEGRNAFAHAHEVAMESDSLTSWAVSWTPADTFRR
jgi:hypothetical protein